jgi:hypothetical protein
LIRSPLIWTYRGCILQIGTYSIFFPAFFDPIYFNQYKTNGTFIYLFFLTRLKEAKRKKKELLTTNEAQERRKKNQNFLSL